jgi:multiple sugar transport system substrate-binding protein
VRRRVLVLGASVGAPLLLAACGVPAAGTGGDTSSKNQPAVKLSFFYPNWGAPDIYVPNAQRKIDAFNQASSRYQVEGEPATGDLVAQVTARFAGGTPPETFWSDHQVLLPYAKQGFAEDLQPLAKQEKTFKKEDLHPSALDGLSVGNKLFGLTGWAFTNLYYYNADLFKQAGLTSPYDLWKQDRWTWDAFLTAATKLSKQEGGKTVQIGTTLGQARLWMNTDGAQEYDNVKIPTRCLYDGEGAVEALQFRNDLQFTQRVYDPDYYKDTGSDETKAFINGKSATISRWTTGLAAFKVIADFKWGMVPYPKKKAYASDYTHWAYVVAKGLPEPKKLAGWEWLRFFSGVEGQKLEAADLIGIPFAKAAQDIFAKTMQQLPSLEHPEAAAEILNKYPNSRLISVGATDIGKLLSEEMGPFYRAERAVRPSTQAAVQRINDWLRANPQGQGLE